MVGTPTLMLVHDLTLDRLETQPQAILQGAREHMVAEPLYAALGALGVNLFDFIPSSPPGIEGQDIAGRQLDSYAEIWREVFRLLNDPEAPDDPDRNILRVLQRMRTLVSDVEAAAEKESLLDLADLRDRLEGFEADREVIEAFLPRLANNNVFAGVFQLILGAARPYAAVPAGVDVPEPTRWSLKDHVSSFRTGQFVERLIANGRDRFDATGDRRFLAYALGFRTAYCTKAVGSPFVNSIVGSVPRLHWWRARWIERFVDAWAWGYYDPNRPPPLEDETEDFLNWRSLCNANLHQRIALGALPGEDPVVVLQSAALNRPMPDAVPQDFREFFADTFREVYGDEGVLGLVTPTRVNDAVAWSWLTLWFTTGSDALGCNPQPPVSIEDGTAFFDPETVDPFETPPVDGDDDDDTPNPLDVEPQPDPNVAQTVCGAILAFLGLVASVFYPVLPALAAVVAGILLAIDGGLNVDWVRLRRDLYVVRWFIYNGVDGLNRMLIFGGLGHPFAYQLQDDTVRLDIPNQPAPTCGFPGGPDLYTGRRTDIFPGELWNVADPNQSWICPVPNIPETPTSIGYATNGTPDIFIDKPSDPAEAGRILDHRAFPEPAVWPSTAGLPVYASAVDNAIDVILREGEETLPDLNLQGDRGIGYRAWEFAGPTQTDPVAIVPVS